jgi:hypothetical protein
LRFEETGNRSVNEVGSGTVRDLRWSSQMTPIVSLSPLAARPCRSVP